MMHNLYTNGIKKFSEGKKIPVILNWEVVSEDSDSECEDV